jgi:7,8-dihydropterin-6-yl-methyl-4-(beta-D-ribofuranosyl)aminobenzene 5'-phosphate synthase
VRITIVYDNTAYDPRLASDWGFAALVEYGEHTLLFDTGARASILLGNMDLLGIDPAGIETVLLSHAHSDHTGGLLGLLQQGVAPTVYLLESFPEAFTSQVAALTEVVEVGSDPMQILPGVFSTGGLGSDVVEQGLVLQSPDGIVVITGCAHPGVVAMVRRARQVAEGEVALVVGGFHLGGASRATIAGIIEDLRALEVRQVAPAHCTGDQAAGMFADAYGEDCLGGGAGRVIVVG